MGDLRGMGVETKRVVEYKKLNGRGGFKGGCVHFIVLLQWVVQVQVFLYQVKRSDFWSRDWQYSAGPSGWGEVLSGGGTKNYTGEDKMSVAGL